MGNQDKKEIGRFQLWTNRLWLIALIIFPFVLWIMPATLFDNTGFELCPSKLIFNLECFGCGMTRAVMHLHHFDWNEAIYYNYAVLIVYPVLVIVWAVWTRLAWKKIFQS